MDAELGMGVAGVFAARLLVEQLAEAVEEAALDILDGDGAERRLEAELGELASSHAAGA